MAINEKLLNTLISQVSALTESVTDIKMIQSEPLKPIYTNDGLKELLGVGYDTLKKYRDTGAIGFSNVGDKYWYTANDVLEFLKKGHRKPIPFKPYQ